MSRQRYPEEFKIEAVKQGPRKASLSPMLPSAWACLFTASTPGSSFYSKPQEQRQYGGIQAVYSDISGKDLMRNCYTAGALYVGQLFGCGRARRGGVGAVWFLGLINTCATPLSFSPRMARLLSSSSAGQRFRQACKQ